MDLYPIVVFIHAATILLFFIAHGTSMFVAFQLKRETEPARVRALLDLSRYSLGFPTLAAVIVGLVAGIAAGFMGDHWGSLWIWISIGLFVVVALAMTPMMTKRLAPIRAAAGAARAAGSGGSEAAEPATEDPAELRRLIGDWNPMPTAIIGLAAFVAILWLMMAKPF